MMFIAIIKLQFFSQFELNKDNLIKELERINCQNTSVVEEKKEDLNIKNDNNGAIPRIVNRTKKKIALVE